MIFHSTNYNSPEVDFKTAILHGQAEDMGLYMLNNIPRLPERVLESFQFMNFNQITLKILSLYTENFIPQKVLKKIIKDALNFDIPIEKITNDDYLCYLDRGPTCSFKDFGARILARIMEFFLESESKNMIILTATSGDTGGAVAQSFYDMSRINVIVLYPKNEISDLQRKQMTTLGKNVISIGINAKFDDCQKLVKMAFSDKDLSSFNLSSANSINFGRLLPQTLYYFWSYSRVIKKTGEKVIFSVPSGNFGNLTGGLIAKRMGLPVEKFISAVNENDEFPNFLRTGFYNAMNVGHPSNLARIVDLYEGRIDENGIINKNPNMELLRKEILSYSINDELTKSTIVDFYYNYNKIIEPHGAVGWAALQIFRNDYPKYNNYKSIVFETAHPSKFPNEIISLINQVPKLTDSLQEISKLSEFPNPIEINNYDDFKNFLIEKFSL
jgi:threonine synthase